MKKTPAYRLTFEDAVVVWKKHWSGGIQSRIAAFFDTNQGRISEVLKGTRHPGSELKARQS